MLGRWGLPKVWTSELQKLQNEVLRRPTALPEASWTPEGPIGTLWGRPLGALGSPLGAPGSLLGEVLGALGVPVLGEVLDAFVRSHFGSSILAQAFWLKLFCLKLCSFEIRKPKHQ